MTLYGIIVTYRRPRDLALMIEALDAQTRSPDRIFVVDNDPERSAEPVVDRSVLRSRITYLPATTNLGPAGGIALGMQRVLSSAARDDWLILLDDDDPPTPDDLIERLHTFALDMARTHDRLGGVGAVGSRFDVGRGRVVRVPDEELVGPVRVDVIAGNQFPIYRVGAIREVGPFDERLFFGFEELEFCLRLRRAGFRLFARGDVWRIRRQNRPTPYVGMTMSLGEPGWRRYYSLRNLIFILRHNGQSLAAARISVVRGFLKPLANLPVSPRLSIRHLRLNAAAAWDGWTGRMGRRIEPGP